jgi:hypothetical protein
MAANGFACRVKTSSCSEKLLQESAVLPWWRERLPLVYAGEKLVAVADLWIVMNLPLLSENPPCSCVATRAEYYRAS